MESHTVRSFDKELQELTQRLLKMGALVNQLIALAVTSLEEHSELLVKDAKTLYKEINALDTEVDKDATAMLALRQPKAVDLRFIISAIKISTSLERMGNLARNNVKRASRIDEAVLQQFIEDFKSIASLIQTMITQVLKALAEQDITLAAMVWQKDDAVDSAYSDLFTELEKRMTTETSSISSCLQIALAAKNFERLGDYVTRLARNVHFIISGKRPKKLKTKEMVAS